MVFIYGYLKLKQTIKQTLQVVTLSGTFKATLKEGFGQIPGYFCKTMRCLKKKTISLKMENFQYF